MLYLVKLNLNKKKLIALLVPPTILGWGNLKIQSSVLIELLSGMSDSTNVNDPARFLEN